jgi:hypothetical protein
MSMIIDGTNGLTFNDSSTQASAGQVLQVVQATLSGVVTYSNPTSFTQTTLTASITPKFSTSKILILMGYTMYHSTSGTAPTATIYKNNATNLSPNSSQGFVISYSNGNAKSPFTINYLDSPATTSSTAYTCYVKVSSGNIDFGDSNGCGTVILMEIAQ